MAISETRPSALAQDRAAGTAKSATERWRYPQSSIAWTPPRCLARGRRPTSSTTTSNDQLGFCDLAIIETPTVLDLLAGTPTRPPDGCRGGAVVRRWLWRRTAWWARIGGHGVGFDRSATGLPRSVDGGVGPTALESVVALTSPPGPVRSRPRNGGPGA